jgi:hypothetical protein
MALRPERTRWPSFHRLGSRRIPAIVVVGAWLAVLLAFGRSTGACSCGPPIDWGRDQPGFQRISAPLHVALERLPFRVRIAPEIGRPVGVYVARRERIALILWGRRSRFGTFRMTVQPRHDYTAHDVRVLASECGACADNRLVELTVGIRGALLAGGNGPNSVTWREHGRMAVVLGPARTFSREDAVAAARALARANV